jgi:hypothetical protein
MSVTYYLKIINNDRIMPVEEANSIYLKEVDKYTSANFNNISDILSKYKIKENQSSKNYVFISYNNGGKHNIYDIVYKEDSLVFNTSELLRQLNIYASPRDKDNITFIRHVAEKFRTYGKYKNICDSILYKINSDCSTEYFTFLRKAFEDTNKNYRVIRDLYFLMKWFEQIKSYNNPNKVDGNDVQYKQINMNEYLEQTKKK